ncbi:MAG: tol-pal system protein YbgF [Paracoccaceae bacterium]|nr:tol-pal system protein YbgF [Paracoccaceae bacterium]
MKYLKLTCFIYLTATGSAFGQGPAASLADIRQEISLLNGELVDLKQELLRSSDILSRQEGLSVFGRLSEVEAQVTRLTGQSEALELRINRIVADGTNRVGDLEFRLTELEGGDPSQLSEPAPLGGVSSQVAADPSQIASAVEGPFGSLPMPELAISEQSDFDAAVAALEAQKNQEAAAMFANFVMTYPGSSLTQEAQFLRGKAFENLKDAAKAARAYLAAFSGQPNGPKASNSLVQLGISLNDLGQKADACVTLQEVSARFPGTPSAEVAVAAVVRLQCP